MEEILADEAATIAFGNKLASQIRAGTIVKITGPLGAGKTTLVRGIVAGLGGNPDEVHSPTFSIVHEYYSPTGSINHCDFYRLPDNSELEELGGMEFFEDEKIYLLEWPEKIRLNKLINSRRLISADLGYDGRRRKIKIT